VFDAMHQRVAEAARAMRAPVFGADGTAAAITRDGDVVVLEVTLPAP